MKSYELLLIRPYVSDAESYYLSLLAQGYTQEMSLQYTIQYFPDFSKIPDSSPELVSPETNLEPLQTKEGRSKKTVSISMVLLILSVFFAIFSITSTQWIVDEDSSHHSIGLSTIKVDCAAAGNDEAQDDCKAINRQYFTTEEGEPFSDQTGKASIDLSTYCSNVESIHEQTSDDLKCMQIAEAGNTMGTLLWIGLFMFLASLSLHALELLQRTTPANLQRYGPHTSLLGALLISGSAIFWLSNLPTLNPSLSTGNGFLFCIISSGVGLVVFFQNLLFKSKSPEISQQAMSS